MDRDDFNHAVPHMKPWKGSEGQALVETALVVPMLLIFAFGVVLAGRIIHSQIAVQAAVREAGRALAAAPSEAEGMASAYERGAEVASGYGLASKRLQLALTSDGFERGGVATARGRYRVNLADLPYLNQVDVTVSSTHRQRIDVYRSRRTTGP